jgi:integrase/recombinase XerC
MPAKKPDRDSPSALQAPAADPVLAARVEAYLQHLAIERRLSANTVESYRRDLLALTAWMPGAGVAGFRDLRDEHLRAFIASEHRRGLSATSLQRRLSALRSFLQHLLKHSELGGNPAKGLRAPKAPRKLPQVLDADEMTRLVEVPTATSIGRRDRAMLELLYSSGLRLSELCDLRWRELDLADGLVRVTGKGGKTRLVPVGSHARAALQEWKSETTPSLDMPVFPGRGGASISPRAVQLRLRQIAQQQGIWKRVHPHLLRHSFASHVLESSGDLRGVQELLGHADIATTQIYTHLDFQHLAKVYDAAHPRARRKR